MALDIVLLVIGLALLVKGADWFVDGGAGTAAAEKISAIFCDCSTCRKVLSAEEKIIMMHLQTLVDKQLLIDFGPNSGARKVKIQRITKQR